MCLSCNSEWMDGGKGKVAVELIRQRASATDRDNSTIICIHRSDRMKVQVNARMLLCNTSHYSRRSPPPPPPSVAGHFRCCCSGRRDDEAPAVAWERICTAAAPEAGCTGGPGEPQPGTVGSGAQHKLGSVLLRQGITVTG